MLSLKNELESFRLDKSWDKIIQGLLEPPEEFKKIAEVALAGSFKVKKGNEVISVHPTCVEFYYHEESGDIKDPIVYHRNTKGSKKDIFEFGSLHNHVSGIDITFEHGDCPENAVRASMLIREFEVNGVKETRSTKLYDWLYQQSSMFDGISVEWKDGEKPVEVISGVRKNVAAYDKEGNKIPASGANGQRLTSNRKYVQDLRPWQFRIKE